jgi:hypothetical protein
MPRQWRHRLLLGCAAPRSHPSSERLGPTATTRLPQVRPDQRLCAIPSLAPAIDGEASLEVRIQTDPGAPVHTIRFVHAGHEEDQPNARILDKVLETIDPIVAAPVGYEQRPTVICNLHEARPIALGRAVSNGALQRRGKTSQIRLAATPSFQILTCQIQFAARVRFAA